MARDESKSAGQRGAKTLTKTSKPADAPPRPQTRTPKPAAHPALKQPVIERMLHHLKFSRAKHWEGATGTDHFWSLALAARDLAVEKMIDTFAAYAGRKSKRVYYLSLEFLLGRLLRANLVNLGLYDEVREAVAALGADLDHVCEIEPDAGLGNGGLGRLAACYLDSAATLSYPVYGYSIRYEYGIFEQRIEKGWQVEKPEYWLQYGTPWELVRPEFSTPVRLFGRVEHGNGPDGRFRAVWKDASTVIGVPYDIPIVGYRNGTVNILRLWSSRASQNFDLEAFNRGGFVEAVMDKVRSETISKILYPADETEQGRQLRLAQQYFFVACTISDILRRFDRENDSIDDLPDKVSLQLNDTHPSLAVAELMRILIDERGLTWERAWELTESVLAFTNHTLLPEALEQWPVSMFERLLPRHLEIIYEINRRFLDQVQQRFPGDFERRRRMSLIREEGQRSVRMAHLAVVGSRAVNGVAQLHSHLLRTQVMPEFAEFWPDRFTNVTNGISPRRWLLACNPGLASAITRRIGDGWVRDLEQISGLAKFADDQEFQNEFREIKQANKRSLADWIRGSIGVELAPEALFDVQAKRLHEYKRQLLNVLHVVMLYHELLGGDEDRVPRVVLFAAKSAPAYQRAKLIIKLVHDVARTINQDERVRGRLRVLFVPNYRVSLAERLIPAADLSEQTSTAGMEASGRAT